MSRSANDRDAEVPHPEVGPDELAAVHERFAEEHEAAADSLPDDLAEPHLGAAEKHREAAREDREEA